MKKIKKLNKTKKKNTSDNLIDPQQQKEHKSVPAGHKIIAPPTQPSARSARVPQKILLKNINKEKLTKVVVFK